MSNNNIYNNYSVEYPTRKHRKIPSYRYNLKSTISSKDFPTDYIAQKYTNHNIYNNMYNKGDINSTTNILIDLTNTLQDTDRILDKNRINVDSTILRLRNLSKSIKGIKDKTEKKKYFRNNTSPNIIKGKKIDSTIREKIELTNLENIKNDLMKSNIGIRKQNKILETEINNYKNQIYSRKSISKDYFSLLDKNSNKIKSLLQLSIKENTQILDKILKIIESNQNLSEQIKNISSGHKQLFKKVEIFNRKNAEIQILNEENENKLNNLQKMNQS